MIDKVKQGATKALLFLQENKAMAIKYMTYTIIVFLLIMYFTYTIQKIRLKNNNNDTLSKLYSQFPQISTLNINDATYQYLLRDYYIKTAYNCCCGGQFKNDYVDVLPLKKCISQGARVLDFEIYSSLDDKFYTICDPSGGIIGVNKTNWQLYDYNYNMTVLEERYNVITFVGGNCGLMYAR